MAEELAFGRPSVYSLYVKIESKWERKCWDWRW